MEKFVDGQKVAELFNLLIDGGVKFALLRNFNNEIPDKLSVDNDIDIIVNPDDLKLLRTILKKNKWKEVRHPWDFGNNFVFLYSMNSFLFYRKDGISLDICFQLCCRSLNRGEWFPLDEAIQVSVWENRKEVSDVWRYELSNEDYLIHLITRSIFDKKKFTENYIQAIESVLHFTDKMKVKAKLEVVFFKFTDTLIDCIYSKEYNSIVNRYITFSDY